MASLTMVLKAALVVACIASCVSADAPLTIDKPSSGESVSERADVEGRVADSKSVVWVVVRPKTAGKFWVQPATLVGGDGEWSTRIHVGDATTPSGTEFEVIAVANPSVPLEEGQQLTAIPVSAARSAVVRIVRE